jgi:hypothetical protein
MQEGGENRWGKGGGGGITPSQNVKDETGMEEDRDQFTMMYSKHFLLL